MDGGDDCTPGQVTRKTMERQSSESRTQSSVDCNYMNTRFMTIVCRMSQNI